MSDLRLVVLCWLWLLVVLTLLGCGSQGDGTDPQAETLSDFGIGGAPGGGVPSFSEEENPSISNAPGSDVADEPVSFPDVESTESPEEPADTDVAENDLACYPECFAKACGDDGCGGSCGACPDGTSCVGGLCEGTPTCVPNCNEMECGDDGCGGTCGICPEGMTCQWGQCEGPPVCQPNCNGKACGDDGCGGSCGDCDDTLECVNSQCVCVPDCGVDGCGDDGCGGSCGPCGCSAQKLFIRAANFTETDDLQVFFITDADETWNEAKSKWVVFPGGGQYETLMLPVGAHPAWTGTIKGIRIDPMTSNGGFGIDDVCLGFSEDECLLHWNFDGATEVVSPFLGWQILGIGDLWTDGQKWGGAGTAGDPLFRTFIEFECEP